MVLVMGIRIDRNSVEDVVACMHQGGEVVMRDVEDEGFVLRPYEPSILTIDESWKGREAEIEAST